MNALHTLRKFARDLKKMSPELRKYHLKSTVLAIINDTAAPVADLADRFSTWQSRLSLYVDARNNTARERYRQQVAAQK